MGNPQSPPLYQYPGPTPTTPMMQLIMGQAGTFVGLANMMVQTLGRWAANAASQATINALTFATEGIHPSAFTYWADTILNNPYFKVVLGIAGIVLSAYSLYQILPQFFKKPSIAGAISVAGSAFGLATGVNMLLGAGMFNPVGWWLAATVVSWFSVYTLMTQGFTWTGFGVALGSTAAAVGLGFVIGGPVGAAIAGIVVASAIVIGFIMSLFGGPSAEQVAAKNLTNALTPIIDNIGPLAFVMAGTTALLFGWHPGHTGVSQAITMPQYYLNQVLAQKNGFVLPPMHPGDAPAVLIEQGTPPGTCGQKSSPTYLTIVSPPSNGSTMDSLQTYALDPNINFTTCSENPNGYIPFFTFTNGHINTTPNPELLTAFKNEEYLLRSVLSGGLSTKEMLSAINLASATNKICADPISTN